MEIKYLKVEEGQELERIDKFITNEIEEFSRTFVQDLIKSGNVLVNEKTIKANYIVNYNDLIVINVPDLIVNDAEPEDIPLDIRYEDSDVIVINKPSGMVVHPAVGNLSGTLVNALMFHCKDLSRIGGEIRAGIVHRIDKDTSGLLVACKNDFAHQNLSLQFFNKTVERKYYAICAGVIPHNIGKIDAPIGRDLNDRQRMGIVENGKHAVTHFKVIERFKKHTLIECELETGRTHQIRVHMKYIGYPILGDPLYGHKKDIDPVFGQYLHAKTLGFDHPRTNERMFFDSELPEYFVKKLEEVKNI